MEANEALTGNRPAPVGLDTRDRRRVTAEICSLAEVFVIAFARIHSREAPLFLLESPSIPWFTAAGRWSKERVDARGLAGY